MVRVDWDSHAEPLRLWVMLHSDTFQGVCKQPMLVCPHSTIFPTLMSFRLLSVSVSLGADVYIVLGEGAD